jgi:hypothetical protein
MANAGHLAKLQEGVTAWNEWRRENPGPVPDLIGAPLSRLQLGGADLSGANLERTNLIGANLRKAKLCGTFLPEVNLRGADLSGADLRSANLSMANLTAADLSGTDLSRSRLAGALLMGTNLENAILDECGIYGISAWDVKLKESVQRNLVITPDFQPTIQVDNLEVAQFIYLLLNNQRIRQVIDTITSKVALILGRFSLERKVVLEAIREELRKRGRLPVLFDFEKPISQTTDETISTLAHIARFVIADLTDAKSILQELRSIVPNNPSVVVQPILLASEEEPGMFDFFRKFPWVLEPVRYTDQKQS